MDNSWLQRKVRLQEKEITRLLARVSQLQNAETRACTLEKELRFTDEALDLSIKSGIMPEWIESTLPKLKANYLKEARRFKGSLSYNPKTSHWVNNA